MQYMWSDLKVSETGTGEQITTIAVGAGQFELVAAAIVGGSGIPTPGRIIYGYREGNANRYTHLKSGYATNNLPLCLDTPRLLEGPGGIVAVMYHEVSEEHTLHITIRRLV